jgi:two-component system, OmpR family, catabolic regulation response regulator CreB
LPEGGVRPAILIIEDEPAIADTIVYALKTEGFLPTWSATGEAGLKALREQAFSLVVLDVGLPDGSGFDFYHKIRLIQPVPILFLSARNTEMDRVLGLEMGGDDYVVKPFSPRELTARVRAVLRRAGNERATQIAPSTTEAPVNAPAKAASTSPANRFEIDDERCCIRFSGTNLELTRYEFRLVRTLAARPGRVFSREQLLSAGWEEPTASTDRTVDAHIKTLRSKMRALAPKLDPIQTHRGLGYSWRET